MKNKVYETQCIHCHYNLSRTRRGINCKYNGWLSYKTIETWEHCAAQEQYRPFTVEFNEQKQVKETPQPEKEVSDCKTGNAAISGCIILFIFLLLSIIYFTFVA
jgi:NAD-dependent SIR2 family protein deacetylase